MLNSTSDRLKKPRADPQKSSKGEHKGSSRKKEPKPTKHGRDDAIKGEKTEDELEAANLDESEDGSDV